MSQGTYSGSQTNPGSNQQYLQPPNYDPRRLFPFGLSPIPEVPSELASEVSSIASYSPTPSLEDSDTEVESVRSRGSIMYSGSCDSIRSNGTIQGKSSSESSTDTEHDSSDEDTEDENDEFTVENIPNDSSPQPVKVETENLSTSNDQITSSASQANNFAEEADSEETDHKNNSGERHIPIVVESSTVPCDMLSGAATASEIFRHLQATRGKQEVTTELAKILTVLKSTLSGEDKDSSSSEDESPSQESKVSNHPNPIGKPPKPPQKIKFSKNSVISPAIQARIRDLEANKPGNPKEEMNLLSKILVHLLCSCKTAAAAQELKRIIRQFKEVAKAAMEEGDDVLENLRSSSRASSRSSKRRARSRTASGNSNVSGNSETDSMNTLTPGDSKSSGTDDETNQETNVGRIRFTSNVSTDKSGESHSCVSYTLTLPLKREEEEEEEDEYEDEEEEYEDDEEWEWEYEDEFESTTPTKVLNESSGSSRNLTPSEAKSDHSSGSTRKILNDMELGAYNTNSDPSNSNSHSTPITEEEDGLLDDDEDVKNEKVKKKMIEKSESSEHLFSHLEETFKVLSDTYKIITTGNSPDCDTNPSSQAVHTEQNGTEKSFEDILDGVSSQCVQLESEIMRSSRQSTATPECTKSQLPSSRPSSRSASRANSRMSSRPASRNKIKTPVPQPAAAAEEEEEDWGEEDEWEYYYEEDYPEESATNTAVASSRPASRVLMRSRPASRQEIAEYKASRPVSRQTVQEEKHESRPSSRVVRRPASRTSRPASRAVSRCSTIKQENGDEEEEDWGDEDEWEYYYEEELPENEAPKVQSRPASRQKQASRASSRQEVELKRVPSRQASRVGSRASSRPASRAKSSAGGGEGDEDEWEYYYEEDDDESANHSATTAPHPEIKVESGNITIPINRIVISRPNSRQSNATSRPSSRSGSRPVSRTSSRPGSRAASRIKRTTSALGNVEEEDEYEWYYEDMDDPELTRLSPTLTTAPTTRATSPFPDEKDKVEPNTGTGFSRRKMSAILESDESTPVPGSRTPTNRGASATPCKERRTATPGQDRRTATPNQDRRTVMSKTPTAKQTGYLNPMAGVSVCLAAEYLGQDAEQLAASLPVNFIEENQVIVEKKKKHKHKHRSKDKDSDNNNEDCDEKKKKKKKKDGKFLPKVGVKELASRLEPQLFQDMQVGNKMVMSREEAKGIIQETKKRPNRLDLESETSMSPVGNKSEDKRKSVREMVELMSNQKLGMDNVSEPSSPPHHIPSISVSSQMVAPPIPPPPQAYYTSPNPQYPPSSYQPYPIEVHAHYSQYPPQSPHSPYQQYPPQSPYHQYPAQQYYQGYPPPPPPPQHYQQYPPQQYAQYHHQQIQGYPPYSQGYPPGPQQPMVYQSETNPNQVRVVSGGQTTVVNMRPKSSNSKQKEMSQGHKSVEGQRTSPNDSEAYGTGSTGSDQTEGQMAGIDHDEGREAEEGGGGKPHKRHSRLFKLLQDSDYTDSDGDSRADFSRISMKNMEDNHSRESDIDSVCSGLERSGGVERKHSFRSHKSSNKESDNESVTSGGMERKISPNSVQNNIKHRRFMQLNLQNTYEPSSSELSTPNSPTGAGPADKRRSQSKPPSRTMNYHADDFDSHAGVSDDSSYQSLQSLNSFDSMYDGIAGREVEEIMKKKVNRDSLYRYQTDSPSGYVLASPKGIDYLRGSPKTHSSSPKLDPYNRNSPKLEQELLELTNFPNSPGLSLRQLQGHRSFYGGK